VYGNMDDPSLKKALPLERIVDVDGARLGMVHIPGPAAGRAARLRARFPGCEAIVYGHTHLPEVLRDDGVWILNPGSPTERRGASGRLRREAARHAVVDRRQDLRRRSAPGDLEARAGEPPRRRDDRAGRATARSRLTNWRGRLTAVPLVDRRG